MGLDQTNLIVNRQVSYHGFIVVSNWNYVVGMDINVILASVRVQMRQELGLISIYR